MPTDTGGLKVRMALPNLIRIWQGYIGIANHIFGDTGSGADLDVDSDADLVSSPMPIKTRTWKNVLNRL